MPPVADSSPSTLLLFELPSLDNSFGAVLLGTFGSLMLYGMTLHQCVRYFGRYPTDRRWLKGMLLLLSSGCIIIVSQSFFAWRVFHVGRRYRILVYVAVSLLVGELAAYTAATVESFVIPTFREFETATWLVTMGSGMTVAADLLLTSTVLYNGNLIYAAFGIIGTKLYANTLLVALNTRQLHSTKMDHAEYTTTTIYGRSVVYNSARAVGSPKPSGGIVLPGVLDIRSATETVLRDSFGEINELEDRI
ncbi:hypothetical protein C8Q76DRAFT_798527 [Earliella scabrosa]|nr:hypothetical protein C8Q76DRAFT_798527 [Earliella scabrosa]